MIHQPFLRAVAATVLFVILFELCAPLLIFLPEKASTVDIIVAFVEAIPFGSVILDFVLGFMTAVASMTNSFMAALGLPSGAFGIEIPTQYIQTHFFVFEFLKAIMVAIIAEPLDALVKILAGEHTRGYFNKYANTMFLLTTVFLSTLLVNRIFDFFQAQLILLSEMAQNIIIIIAILIVLVGGFFAVKAFVGSFIVALITFFLKTVGMNLLRAILAYAIAFCVLIISGFPNLVTANPFFILALFGMWWLVMIFEGVINSKIADLIV